MAAGTPQRDVPTHASVVIIGGGVIGASVAFHLAEAGVPEVVLLEGGHLASGSTSKAAGGVRAQFSDSLNIQLAARSLQAFERFEQRPGQNVDLRQTGYLFLLDRNEDVPIFEKSVALQNSLGVNSRMITATDARRLCPLIETDGIVAASYSPTDGHCTPESVVLGYATAARRLGATIVSRCPVTGIEVVGGEIVAVLTDPQRVATSVVICAAGAWSRLVGDMAGVDLPVDPYRRQILYTSAVPGLPENLPMTIDFSSTFYFHGEGGGLLLGMSDPDETAGFKLTMSDAWLDRLASVMAVRAPQITDMPMAGGWAGLYEVTPDHNAIIGESKRPTRFLYATGFSGHGFLMGPAVGEVMRDLYLGASPFVDISPLSVERFTESRSRPEVNII